MEGLNFGTGLKRFVRPETIWAFRSVMRRQVRPPVYAPGQTVTNRLPWGSQIDVQHDEYIGSVITNWLLYDLSVCELIARLVVPGETVLDVGANIGQMTSLLAAVAGSQGRVFAFEPHPVTVEKLEKNVANWTVESGHARIEVMKMALGAEQGTASLKEEPNFDENPGLTSLVGSPDSKHAYEVKLERLDDIEEIDGSVGLMKLDVEDYEKEVIKGATGLLESGRVRDVVFEDHCGYPSDLTKSFEKYGFSIFTLERGLTKPRLCRCVKPEKRAFNFLATLDPARALKRFRGVGYSALRRRVG